MSAVRMNSPAASGPVRLDHAAIDILADLTRNGAHDLLRDILSMFLDATPAVLERLRRDARTGDMRAVQHASHDLKSASATLGARLLSSHCGRLEAIARAGLSSETPAVVAEIAAEFDAVRPLLTALLPRPSETPSETTLTAEPV